MASSEGGALGRGGMYTKVMAAKRASRSGTATLIASGFEDDVLLRLRKGESLGTLLMPDLDPMTARKQWLAGHLQAKGTLVLDLGASRVLSCKGKSLLPVGVTSVSGDFQRGEMVVCVDSQGKEIARGLVNYSSQETKKIIGKSSKKIEEILGYSGGRFLIHCDNLVILDCS